MTNLFYRNPRLLALAVCLIFVAGASSYAILPRMEDPLLTERAANVNTMLPGADAERVESLVTEKIEEQLQEIEEIKEIRSSSRVGISTVSIELRDDIYEVDSVWSRIRDKIDDVVPELPSGSSEPEFEQLDVKAYALIVALTWTAETPPNFAVLRRLAEDLKDAIQAVTGTEQVDLFGDPDEEITVEVDTDALTAIGLTTADVASQIQASDAKVSAGQLRGARNDLIMTVSSELDSLHRIGSTPIRFGGNGQFVQLVDIAEVTRGIVDPPSSLAYIDGRPAVALGALIRSNSRIDRWTTNVNETIDRFEGQLPSGVTMHRTFVQNRYVESRLISLLSNLLVGGLAVIGVIFVMMGWRSALVVGSALPLSALMVLACLRFLEIPIHQMSVTGLIIALGLLIDNAIVVVDEVSAKLRTGRPPAAAVSDTVRHLMVPLFGSTLTTALAFAPIALMPGPAGEFVGAIAISVILAIASSFLLAMTVVPAFSAIGIKPSDTSAEDQTDPWWRVGWSSARLTRLYRRSLEYLFRRPALGLLLGVVLPLFGFIQFRHLSEQFFPPADRDQCQIELELPAHASLKETVATAMVVRDRILGHEQVRNVHWFLGESGPTFYYNVIPRRKNTSRYAQAIVQLSSSEGTAETIRELQATLDQNVPDAKILVRQLEQGPPFNAPIEIRLFGPDVERLRDLGEEMRSILAGTPDVIHSSAELSEPLPQLDIVVDEEQARLASLDHASIAAQLNFALEGAVGGSIVEATEELPVRVSASDTIRGDLERINSLSLLPAQGRQVPTDGSYLGVPLSSIASVRLAAEVAAIPHFNGRRMNEVQAFITAGVLPADVLAGFEQKMAKANFELPPGYSFQYGGESAKRDDAIGNLMASVGVLLVLMVATLVLSFRSFRIATLIGSVALLSVGLSLGALWLFGYPFGFMAIVGTMGLIGVAINDAIVVLAALREDQQARDGDVAAVVNVVVRSTRHIVATSLTTMAGFAPLVIAGGGFWPPLAIAIAGGVGGATILALYYVPAAYVMLMCRGCQQLSENHSTQPQNAPRNSDSVPALAGL